MSTRLQDIIQECLNWIKIIGMKKRYLCLLRGINVSGHKIIKMADLRIFLSNNGLENVKTYIQSGNILFYSEIQTKAEISIFIENLLFKEYGCEIPSLILEQKDLEQIILSNPYPKITETSTNKPYVCIPQKRITKNQMELLNELNYEGEYFTVTKHGVYLYCTKERNRCKLSNNLIESELGISCSTRNWRTLLKLQSLFSTP